MTNYEIKKNNKFNSTEVYFESRPTTEVREALKGLKMRWHNLKKCWYGKLSEDVVKEAIESAVKGDTAKPAEVIPLPVKKSVTVPEDDMHVQRWQSIIATHKEELTAIDKLLAEGPKLKKNGEPFQRIGDAFPTVLISKELLCRSLVYVGRYLVADMPKAPVTSAELVEGLKEQRERVVKYIEENERKIKAYSEAYAIFENDIRPHFARLIKITQPQGITFRFAEMLCETYKDDAYAVRKQEKQAK